MWHRPNLRLSEVRGGARGSGITCQPPVRSQLTRAVGSTLAEAFSLPRIQLTRAVGLIPADARPRELASSTSPQLSSVAVFVASAQCISRTRTTSPGLKQPSSHA